ncbi:hypothetical protein [Microbacterium sp.]|uniref:hypothetical protein n=1 Tax=Microbacterium sp. TaxID=51671 RepID=UPI0039E279A3
MPDTSRLVTILRRARWLVPVLALGLAALSAGLGQLAYARVLAQPEHPISFIVEGDLPHGITQETVEAAAEGRALSYEPFTVLVVERELTWDEYEHGEIPQGADVMLSVGFDPADPDLTLPDARRAAVAELAALDDWRPQYRVSTDVRETFLNNVTQGHGPGAVVGAALTAASEVYDGGTRSPAYWGAIAVLPLLVALMMTLLWLRFVTRERARLRAFSRARLQLARVVLELDLLEAHFRIADAELGRVTGRAARNVAEDVRGALQADWSAIRRDSLRLAHAEQVLTRELLDPRAPVHERGKPGEPMPLAEFAASADALRRRADALAASSSLRVGHAAGGTVLGRVALPPALAVEEILRHRDALPRRDAENLAKQRRALLALVQEGESSFGTESGPDVIVRHADLIDRWRRTEKRLTGALAKVDRALRNRLGNGSGSRISDDDVTARERERVRVATGGQMDTLDDLRTSLGISPRGSRAPSWLAERVLLRVESLDGAGGTEPSSRGRRRPADVSGAVAPSIPGTALVAVPVIVALVSGWIAVSTMEGGDTGYGRTLVGDRPLAALHIAGDISLIPDYAAPQRDGEPSNAETLTLESVREQMERNARYGDHALLPERVELIVALLPLDDYVSARPIAGAGNRIEIDYLDLLDAYPRIKREAAAVQPEAIDPATGDVRPGHAILPLWLGADGSYGAGLPLTGELSTGVDSRLGAYDFVATEPSMYNAPGEEWSLPIGAAVASTMSDLGRQMEYNNQRAPGIEPAALFWTVAIAAWTAMQTLVLAGLSLAQIVRRNAGTRESRRQLREMREKLNRLALGLDLSRLDAVAVLGAVDGHGGRAAETDQHLYETLLLTAWREVQELEELPRRRQRGPEWRTRVARMQEVIDSLAERDADVAAQALALIRSDPAADRSS